MSGNGDKETQGPGAPVNGNAGGSGRDGIESDPNRIAGSDGPDTVNPASAAAAIERERAAAANSGDASGPAPFGYHADGTPRKRRPYAPRGTGAPAREAKEKDKASLRGIERLLLSLHTMGALFLASPELELDEKEAKDLSNAIQGVQEHYSVSISPKAEAWANLAVVMAGIYGTRAVSIISRKSAEKKAAREKAKAEREQSGPAGNVHKFQPLDLRPGSVAE